MERKHDLSQVAKVARDVELRSVSCREFSARRQFELANVPKNVSWGGAHEATGHRELDSSEIVVIAKFFAGARPTEQGEGGYLAEVSATFALRYGVPKEALAQLDAEAVQDFAETNGIYNAWPYWRELLQTSAARVGIPGVVAPVFRLVSQPNPKADEVSK